MRGLIFATLGTAASVGCAFAAVGVALYGGSPSGTAAALLYGGVGLCVGGVCSLLDLAWHRLPTSVRGEQGSHRRGLPTTEPTYRPSRFGT